eukprot:TRINITY_DN271_c0_g2_i1.p1 TRINITY_DN271_c0_g2~~TRINITY_DN271_c0_g2_i1.p1  ORF type:complete len:973 (+),score=154.53 TRINITY_DN271_c0_g2_i1:315-3233(+)
MRIVIEVVGGHNLMPKDGQGSCSAYVEVDYGNQRFRTPTKDKDLSPMWNEKLSFVVADPSNLPLETLDVYVYHENRSANSRNFLGRVRIYGSSIPREAEAVVQQYPLEKRGIFSHIRGDISLRIYYIEDNGAAAAAAAATPYPVTDSTKEVNSIKEVNKKEAPAVHVVESIKHKHHQQTPQQNPKTVEEKKQEVKVVQMHNTVLQSADYSLKETNPELASLRTRRDRLTSTYDLVEEMKYLFVRVVKARDLPTMDISGSCDPYAEVRLGNYRGRTKHFEKTSNPEWNQVFAFSKERVQSSTLEVVVKDKDMVKDDFIGCVVFDVNEIPTRVPPDSPLAPQWYRLDDKHREKKVKGEIMLAVWNGTQADEAFPDAWYSDAISIPKERVPTLRSKVYLSPRLWYLRVNVYEAQDLVPSEKSRLPESSVKVNLGNQMFKTKVSAGRGFNAAWNEEFMFVAAEPFEEHLVITVEDRQGPNKDEVLGRAIIPLSGLPKRPDNKPVPSRWYNLERHTVIDGEKKEPKFASKIHLRLILEGGYHVLDESTHYSSDLRPTMKQLWKKPVGVLELGILGAQNLQPMKSTKEGKGTTDAYCVAKYSQKWVRTRTVIDSLNPKWNEQYTWEVYDPCTVITIGVFDNNHPENTEKAARDAKIGKVRIRLSTLQTERVYTHSYPLLVLQPSGVKKMGELHLAIRFSSFSILNMMHSYGRPLLPKMHYILPFSVTQLENLRYRAISIVAARLSRAEPPLKKEVVEYMVDVDSHLWSMRKSKANFSRIMDVLSPVIAVAKWFNEICNWTNPATTILFHLLFLILVFYPQMILPTVFLYMFLIGVWNFRFRARNPPHMDTRLSHADTANRDELDEEFDTFPTSKGSDIVRMRYDRLRSVAGKIQTVIGDMATQGERLQHLLSWRDPRATTIFVTICLISALVLYVTPLTVVVVALGLYQMKHPRFRHKLPSVPVNYFRRLPARTDSLL